jgi:peptide deformylase
LNKLIVKRKNIFNGFIGGFILAVRKIVNYPADILEQECELVTVFDKKLAKLLDDMYDTMIEFDGVGLAAPQIDINKQIAIVDIEDEHGTIELINPEIIETGGEQTGPEGCLSFPGLYGEVTRPNYVKVKAQNRKGKSFEIEAEEFLARAILHEIDHLHGVLFTSKVTRYMEEAELEELNQE